MIKILFALLAVLGSSIIGLAQTTSPTQQPPPAPHTNLKVGDKAPDFNLPSTIVGADNRRMRYKLSDFKGKKNVVLAFYVFAFTGG
ncbi:MAG TPA: redoxin domain-containing protein [Pyrinomonadaceae bacterium]|nr:redoxin domain-containing protein [Pyrinomonadaceae bacterium]